MWLQLSRKQETSRKLLIQVAKQKQGGRCGGGCFFNLFFPLLTWSTGACYISPTIHLLLEF